ncbi:MAG: DEAD/DEAH box helicase [Bacteroidota bacterium]
METFQESGLNPKILTAILELGYERPTPIQQQAIPHLIEKEEDLIGLAQTGTGKTAAFGLPLLQLLDPEALDIQALVLAPTRELCVQIGRDLQDYSKYLDRVNIVPVYGGAPIDKQIRQLKRVPQVVVGTPGRTLDLIRRRKLDLSGIKFLVLDEADEMLRMGFKEDLDAILEATPDTRKSLLFSATMPAEIETIGRNYMRDPAIITTGERNSGAVNVQHWYYVVKGRDRYLALKRIADLHPEIYGIIFCRTRKETKEVSDQLMADGYNADALHGDLTQAQRDVVMKRFRARTLQLLVATDVAARGLDINDLSHVINYRLPETPESYVHRSGRTGRAGKKGISLSIVDPRDMRYLKVVQDKVGKEFEYQLVPDPQDIVSKQVFHYIDRVENAEVDEGRTMQFMESIFKKLEWLDREALIQRFVAVEFDRFLKYYKRSRNLNAPLDRQKKLKSKKGTLYARFFINLGSKQHLNPSSLIQLINDTPGMEGVAVGKIEIMKKFSFFEIDVEYEETVLSGLNGLDLEGITLSVERTKDKPKTSPRPGGGKKNFFKKGKKKFGNKKFGGGKFSGRKSGGGKFGGKKKKGKLGKGDIQWGGK